MSCVWGDVCDGAVTAGASKLKQQGGEALAAETRVGDAIQTESRFGSATACLRNIDRSGGTEDDEKIQKKGCGVGGVGGAAAASRCD